MADLGACEVKACVASATITVANDAAPQPRNHNAARRPWNICSAHYAVVGRLIELQDGTIHVEQQPKASRRG